MGGSEAQEVEDMECMKKLPAVNGGWREKAHKRALKSKGKHIIMGHNDPHKEWAVQMAEILQACGALWVEEPGIILAQGTRLSR